jgi:hypothetical protein
MKFFNPGRSGIFLDVTGKTCRLYEACSIYSIVVTIISPRCGCINKSKIQFRDGVPVFK